MLAHVEDIRRAAKEELEAQRIYVETARLRLEARGILAQLQEELASTDSIAGNGANGHDPISEMREEWPPVDPDEPMPHQEEASSEVDSNTAIDEKKGSRKSGT